MKSPNMPQIYKYTFEKADMEQAVKEMDGIEGIWSFVPNNAGEATPSPKPRLGIGPSDVAFWGFILVLVGVPVVCLLRFYGRGTAQKLFSRTK
jgi:hypothetical protein